MLHADLQGIERAPSAAAKSPCAGQTLGQEMADARLRSRTVSGHRASLGDQRNAQSRNS